MRLSNLRIANQLLLLFVLTGIISSLITLVTSYTGTRVLITSEFQRTAAAQATALAEAVSVSLGNQNNQVVVQILAAPLARSGAADAVAVYDAAGSLVTEARAAGSTLAQLEPARQDPEVRATLQQGVLRTVSAADSVGAFAPVRLSGKLVGVVFIGQGLSSAYRLADSRLPGQIVFALLPILLGLVMSFWVSRSLGQPLQVLAERAAAIGRGDLSLPPESPRQDEVGQLTNAFRQMVNNLEAARAEVAAQQGALEGRVAARTAELEQTLAELKTTLAEREQLSAAVRELGTPVVPVLRGVLVMPLIGTIDSGRAAGLLEALLRGVERHRAQTVILDATGVPIIDTQVARVLLQAADAAALLGARVTLVGLQPEVAQTIVGLGLDLSRLQTRADLQTAVAEALRGAA